MRQTKYCYSNGHDLGDQLTSYIINQIVAIIVVVLFLSLYFIMTGDFFISDWNRRNQIYKNEYMIKLVDERIEEIKVEK
ncbi:hypothetical protein V7111_08715 [Neobacillus niacini]|uniref:hypothetical protein n=1 Tax=Neobacillus niacini TaxID=86668 RepID=UPI003000B8E1